ncbi:MAG: hypothetical protein KDA28_11470, partial [Phycisphaerales bacterium]|nr:hypothetical protein [Phycisphaerales bacterium]
IILVIDNSRSMTEEILAVQDNINTEFADIIGDSGLDYRVILLSMHGDADRDQSICISPPLAGEPGDADPCDPLDADPLPPNGRFYHYTVEVRSHNALAVIIETYNDGDLSDFTDVGWSEWLREDAVKIVIVITDDEADHQDTPIRGIRAEEFDNAALALDPPHFGGPGNRNYIFYSIVGLEENDPATAPYPPEDPLVRSQCGGSGDAEAPGLEYQQLSRLTGGLRFPICQHASFGPIFNVIAEGVIESARIQCDFSLPSPPDGMALDLDTITLEYTPESGIERVFTQVADAASCTADGFYIDRGSVVLCPSVCDEVEALEQGELSVYLACGEPDGPCEPSREDDVATCTDGIDNDCD